MSLIDDMKAAIAAAERPLSEVLVAILLTREGLATLRKSPVKHFMEQPGAPTSLCGVPIYQIQALKCNAYLFADGSTEPVNLDP